MKKFILCCVALALSACSTFAALEGSISTPKAAAAVALYDAAETGATVYLKLPPCGTASSIAGTCLNKAAVAPLVQAVRNGRIARNAVFSLIVANPNGTIPIATFDTFQTAFGALQTIEGNYGVKSVSVAPATTPGS